MSLAVTGPDLSAARCSVTWNSAAGHEVLAVFDDGDVWFWCLRARLPARVDLAGTFHLSAVPGHVSAVPGPSHVGESSVTAAVTSLAALATATAAVAAPPGEGGDPAGAPPGSTPQAQHGVAVTSRSDDGDTVVGWVPEASPSAAGVEAAAAPLVEAALANPLRAVRLGAATMAPPVGDPVLVVSATSIGSAPATLSVTGVSVGTGSAWHDLDMPRMGLVGVDGTLLDGLYRPAVIAPGTLGAWVLAVPAPVFGDVAGARVTGSLQICGPWPQTPAVSAAWATRAMGTPIGQAPLLG